MPRKQSKQRERRYVVEYVSEKLPERRHAIFNVPIGPPPEVLAKAHPEVPLSAYRRWRLYADAVVIMPDRLILIEAKLRKPSDGLGKLIQYRPLVKQTPELTPYINLPLECRLVTPRPDPRVITPAAANDIIVAIFKPDWAMAYLRELGLVS